MVYTVTIFNVFCHAYSFFWGILFKYVSIFNSSHQEVNGL